jgi:hypothetical protein
MRRVLVLTLLGVLLWSTPVPARRSIADVQTATAGAPTDDVVLTFASATSASNVVVAGYRLSAESQILDVQGVTETVLHLATIASGFEVGIVCFVGGGNNYVFQSNQGGTLTVAAVEFSGTDGCTESGTSDDRNLNGSSPNAADAPPSVAAGDLVFGFIAAGNTANFSCDGSYTCIPSDGTDIGGLSLGQWRIAPSGGTYDSPFTWTGTENTLLAVAGVSMSGGGATPCGRRGLLRVGCEN